MDIFRQIIAAELQAWELIGPYVGIIIAFIGAQIVVRWAANVACGLAFRFRGFKPNHLVRAGGHVGRITRIGLTSTTFRIVDVADGTRWEEYLEVLNSRLEYLEIRRLVDNVHMEPEKG